MDCDVVRRTLSDGDRRTLRGKRLRGHLRSCAGCHDFERALHPRPAELAALAPPLPLGPLPPCCRVCSAAAAWGAVRGGGLLAGITGAVKGIAGVSLATKVATGSGRRVDARRRWRDRRGAGSIGLGAPGGRPPRIRVAGCRAARGRTGDIARARHDASGRGGARAGASAAAAAAATIDASEQPAAHATTAAPSAANPGGSARGAHSTRGASATAPGQTRRATTPAAQRSRRPASARRPAAKPVKPSVKSGAKLVPTQPARPRARLRRFGPAGHKRLAGPRGDAPRPGGPHAARGHAARRALSRRT